MSELFTTRPRADIRLQLLGTVSAVALLVAAATQAKAEDTDRPTVWIELGGQLSRLQDGQETFAPPLMDGRPSIFDPSQRFEKPPNYSFDESGAVSIQPNNSNWMFSASVRYGRSKSEKHHLQQTNPGSFVKYLPGYGSGNPVAPLAQKFAETKAQNTERHVVLDFEVGKDVGLGLFGNKNVTSIISAGVRFAQFGSKTNISLKSDTDWHFSYKYLTLPPPLGKVKGINGQPFHSNLASMSAERSFHGVGPSLSWNASVPIAGHGDAGAIAVDWGLNAALLFGRQKTRTHHQTTARYFSGRGYAVPHTVSRSPATPDHTRSRSVTVPNIGAFAGLAFKYPNAKVSFGYRADFFFGAMDGGIDTRKTYDRSFYGPYATVSIGLGG